LNLLVELQIKEIRFIILLQEKLDDIPVFPYRVCCCCYCYHCGHCCHFVYT